MPTKQIGPFTTTYATLDKGTTFVLGADSIVTADAGIISGDQNLQNDLTNNVFEINSKLSAKLYGIVVYGSGNTVSVGEAGTVAAATVGVGVLGNDNKIVNHGSVTTTDLYAIYMAASAAGTNSFENYGEISSTNNVSVWMAAKPSAHLSVHNHLSGTIATGIGIGNADATADFNITNEGVIGSIAGASFAVFLDIEKDTVRNLGVVVGEVALGGGDDTFDNRGGYVSGYVYGGLGDDTYVIDSTLKISEDSMEGTDTVRSAISINLATTYATQSLENIVLFGSANVNATGNTLVNTITGNVGNNLLDGGMGMDALIGGKGNDTYVIDDAGDTVTEAAGEGTDTVRSSVDWTLADNLENLVLTGINKTGKGNSAANTLTGDDYHQMFEGFAGNDVFDSRDGNDDLYGGIGNDTYVLRGYIAHIHENAGEGTDTVKSDHTFFLATNLENLTLTGSAISKAYGNKENNILTGNSAANAMYGFDGNDTLKGAAGADAMYGGVGNDSYYVDVSSDKAIDEAISGGTDIVYSTATSYTLSAYIEKLTLQGTAAINGKGNALANTMVGNAGKNLLDGLAGNDVINGGSGNDKLIGGAGNDMLTGGTGNDIFLFKSGFGKDTITDFKPGQDRIDISTITAAKDFAWVQAHTLDKGDNAVISIGSDTITLKGVQEAQLDAGDFLF